MNTQPATNLARLAKATARRPECCYRSNLNNKRRLERSPCYSLNLDGTKFFSRKMTVGHYGHLLILNFDQQKVALFVAAPRPCICFRKAITIWLIGGIFSCPAGD